MEGVVDVEEARWSGVLRGCLEAAASTAGSPIGYWKQRISALFTVYTYLVVPAGTGDSSS